MWKVKSPCFGDHIRVCRGMYYHHGIYASDDCVIHFASEKQTDRIDPVDAKIISTNLDRFLMGGILEVKEYNEVKRSPSEVVNYAFMQIGTRSGTYNLVSNNCEHFASECVLGVKKSEQVEDVLSMLFGGRRVWDLV